MKTWIKFCGTTSLDDALASIDAGADALGFIFAPSRRRVIPEKAQDVIRRLPAGLERIGVFMGATAEEVCKVVMEVDITGIQLHGDLFVTEVYDSLPSERRKALRFIQTVLVNAEVGSGLREVMSGKHPAVDVWLFDSGAGSGKTFDWKAAEGLLVGGRGKYIIAGGLNPANVGEAVRVFSPWGVDVVSGIEREPGRKDPGKMNAFVAAVRKAEQQ